MAGWLGTLKGETDGSTTTGTFPLDGDLLQETVDHVRIPKGLKAKIWCKRVSGEAVDVKVEYTYDVTEGTPTYKLVGFERLASSGELSLEKRRPIILNGFTGLEAFRLLWAQGTAAKSYVEVEVEITNEGNET